MATRYWLVFLLMGVFLISGCVQQTTQSPHLQAPLSQTIPANAHLVSYTGFDVSSTPISGIQCIDSSCLEKTTGIYFSISANSSGTITYNLTYDGPGTVTVTNSLAFAGNAFGLCNVTNITTYSTNEPFKGVILPYNITGYMIYCGLYGSNTGFDMLPNGTYVAKQPGDVTQMLENSDSSLISLSSTASPAVVTLSNGTSALVTYTITVGTAPKDTYVEFMLNGTSAPDNKGQFLLIR